MRRHFTQSLELDTNQKYLQRLQRTFCSFHTDIRASRNLHLVGSTDGNRGYVSLCSPGRGSAAGPEKNIFQKLRGRGERLELTPPFVLTPEGLT
jgi:hypothetical protein